MLSLLTCPPNPPPGLIGPHNKEQVEGDAAEHYGQTQQALCGTEHEGQYDKEGHHDHEGDWQDQTDLGT